MVPRCVRLKCIFKIGTTVFDEILDVGKRCKFSTDRGRSRSGLYSIAEDQVANSLMKMLRYVVIVYATLICNQWRLEQMQSAVQLSLLRTLTEALFSHMHKLVSFSLYYI